MAKIHSKQIQVATFGDSSTIEESGSGSGQLQIMDDGVTYAKLQNLATANRLLGSAATGLIGEVQVATDMIADDAVEYAKLQDLGTANRLLGSASTGLIGEVQVATDMIADDAVTAAKLANTVVTAAAYGAADKSLVVTVDAQGRLTAAAESAISILHAQVSDFDAGVQTNRLDQMTAPTADVSLNSRKLTSLASPTAGTDAANKSYVDDLINGLAWEEPVIAEAPTTSPSSPTAGDRYLVLASAPSWLSSIAGMSSGHAIAEWDGSAWAVDANVETGSAVLVRDEGVIYVKGSSSWVQASMPTDYAFGDGLGASSGVVSVNVNRGLAIASDTVGIANNGVTRDHIADFAAQGAIMLGGTSGAPEDLAMGSRFTVLQAGSSSLEYALLGNDNIGASAGIAITKLAAKQISGHDLGTSLSALTATANTGLVFSASYDGSATANVGIDFERIPCGMLPVSFGAGTVTNVVTGTIVGLSGSSLSATLLHADHPMQADFALFRNGILHNGQRVTSALSGTSAAGTYRFFQNASTPALLDFEIMSSTAEAYDGDTWSFMITAENA
jgi:hypothetical protein